MLACAIIVGWALTGPLFDYSDSWQLVINTSTTIITFLMVFVIQNTQNRDSKATQIKLDELIRAMEGAHNALLDLEQLTEQDLNRLRDRYIALAAAARAELAVGGGQRHRRCLIGKRGNRLTRAIAKVRGPPRQWCEYSAGWNLHPNHEFSGTP